MKYKHVFVRVITVNQLRLHEKKKTFATFDNTYIYIYITTRYKKCKNILILTIININKNYNRLLITAADSNTSDVIRFMLVNVFILTPDLLFEECLSVKYNRPAQRTALALISYIS